MWSLRVKDRYADNGLVGVAIARADGAVCEIDSFLMSCRVIGRTVETALLAHLADDARQRGATVLQGWFLPTKKNVPAEEFYRRHGFEIADRQDGGVLWRIDLTRQYNPAARMGAGSLSLATKHNRKESSSTVNTPLAGMGRLRPSTFFLGLLLLCASTLMYEIALTRLLSVVSWYYLAFVSISMAMFGMTAGALAVQFRPDLFTADLIPKRLVQSALAMAISLPLSLMTMLAVPLYTSFAAQTVYNFLLFSAIISVPFFFSGIAVCLSLTRMPFPMGRIYFADLMGAALGCIGSVVLLGLLDAPSAIFMISALLFASSALYAAYAGESRPTKTAALCTLAMAVLSLLNASTYHGIQPSWVKGKVDPRTDILAERWNPISRVRAQHPSSGPPMMWGASPKLPSWMQVEAIELTIDSDADTPMSHFEGDLSKFPFLRYDVTSVGAQLRHGGSAAIIGVGGGRDVLNAAANGFQRIVGIEVNSAIAGMTLAPVRFVFGIQQDSGI